MRVGVISRTDSEAAFPIARRVLEHLHNNGVEHIVETETAMALDMRDQSVDLTEMEVNFMISVGGDGTMLRTAMGLNPPETPILGINLGRRGFLCEVAPEETEASIDKALNGDYQLETCLKLSSRSVGMVEDFPDALNEVLVSSSLPSKMIIAKISVDGEDLTEIQADGIIVSTPTGSTAYNVSAGGSILAPGVDAIIVTAVCPYSYFRSITLPATAHISIELLKPKADALAIIDGKVYTALKPFTTVEVEASGHKTRFIRFKHFYGRLRNRISHLQSQ
jgi:NAD+ kinase